MTNSGIVCIGGSAGSLPPLLTIMAALPPDFHIPVVVVLHRGQAVGRSEKSRLWQLVNDATQREVREIEDLDKLTPDTVFIAPPGYHTLVSEDSFVLSAEEPAHYSIPSIDALFESAADAFGQRTVAVALSCANADGAHGAAMIATVGGTVIIQEPASTEQPALVDRIIADGTHHDSVAPKDIAHEAARRFS